MTNVELQNRIIRVGRILWLFLALNAVLLIAIYQWVLLWFVQNPPDRTVQGLAELNIPLGAYMGFFFVATTVLFLVFFVVAVLIYLRRPQDGFALFTSIFLLGFGASNAYPQFAEFVQFNLTPPFWYLIPSILSTVTSWTLLPAFLVLYPNGRVVPRWTWLIVVVGFLTTFIWGLFPALFVQPNDPLALIGAATATLLTAGAVYAQFLRYRYHSSPLEKQQTKWFVIALTSFFGFTVASFLPLLGTDAAPTPAASIWSDMVRTVVNGVGYMVLPIAVGIAILRYRLWDIDVIVRRTLTYAIVTACLLLVFFGSVILLQQAFGSLTGYEQDEIVTVISTLAIAALFVPVRNRVQSVIDRRFNRKKYDAQQVLQEFSKTVRDETDLENLTARLMQVVDETMQPKSVSVWLKHEANLSKSRTQGNTP